jgi:plasmid maintenance system antidote protein VapI
MSIISRIQDLYKALDLSQSVFARSLDISPSTISNAIQRNKGLNVELIEKILKVYPNVNAYWLLLGNGSMFLEGESKKTDIGSVQQIAHSNHQSIIHQAQGKDGVGGMDEKIQLLEARIKDLEARIKDKEELIALLKK